MLYDFDCECGLKLKADFDFGSCPDSIPCECGKVAKAKTVDVPMMKRVLTELE